MPFLPLQRCADCSRKTASKRCPPCRQAFRRREEIGRASRQARGLDAEYERSRRIVLAANRETHGGLCNYCWSAPATTTDHRVPRIAGGTNAIENLIPACANCNGRKGAKPLAALAS